MTVRLFCFVLASTLFASGFGATTQAAVLSFEAYQGGFYDNNVGSALGITPGQEKITGRIIFNDNYLADPSNAEDTSDGDTRTYGKVGMSPGLQADFIRTEIDQFGYSFFSMDTGPKHHDWLQITDVKTGNPDVVSLRDYSESQDAYRNCGAAVDGPATCSRVAMDFRPNLLEGLRWPQSFSLFRDGTPLADLDVSWSNNDSALGLVGSFGLNLYVTKLEMVAPVPLPAAAWLFVSAVGALFAFSHRRQGFWSKAIAAV